MCAHLFITNFPVDTRGKLNIHKTYSRRPERLLNVFCTFNLRPVSTGLHVLLSFFRSSHKEVSEICSRNPSKTLVKKFIFSKVAGLNFAKNELLHRYFSKILTANFTC